MGWLLWETIERTKTGPLMKEDEFETEYLPKILQKIVAEHDIKYDPEEPVMTDPSMADEIFDAGIEFLTECGLYCKDTKRIVKFTESEIKSVIKTRKREVTVGWGRDQITISPRGLEDKKHPYTFPAAGWIGRDVELWTVAAYTVALEPTTDGMFASILDGVGEISPTSGAPTETLVVETEARAMREAAARAGRPGLFLGIPMNGSSPIALMHVFSTGFYNKHNCMMPVHILQDMRINYDRLNLAYFAQQHGIIPWMSSCPIMYAFVAGPEQAAVEGIAHVLGMMAISDGSFTQAMSCTVDSRYEGRDVFWANSAQALAAERNLKVPWISYGMGIMQQLGSDMDYYAAACNAIVACISGMEGMWMAGGTPGIEARWSGEITRAAAGIKVNDGVAVIKELLKRYEDKAKGMPTMEITLPDFYEIYDRKTLKPTKKYLEQYSKMTKIFKDLGFDYPTWG